MFHKIRELKSEGKSNVEIGQELKLHRHTVAKYLQMSSIPGYVREKSTREDPFAAFKSKVEIWIKKADQLSSTEIFELLVEEGYQGSLRTVKRRLREIKAQVIKERFFEQTYDPAEQSQFDFKERIKIPFEQGEVECYLHFGTLPCSNKFFIRAYPGKNFECFMDGIYEFFSHIGGMTKNIRIDNLSPCVSKVYKGSKRKYTKAFEKATEYFGFGVLPCSPGKGNEKGDVERDIRTHAKRILNLIKLKNICFDSFDDLNNWLVEYCEKRTSPEIALSFQEEKQHLLGLLDKKENVLYRTEEKMPTPYGMLKHDDATYSVPDHAIGKRCVLIFTVDKVKIKILESNELVAVHPRGISESILLEHVVASLLRKPAAMVRWSHKDALFPHAIYKKLYNRLKRIASFKAEHDYLKILNLIQYTDINELTLAIEIALESNLEDLYGQIKELILNEHHPDNVFDISEKMNQKRLNVELSDYDSLIPKGEKNDSSRISRESGGAEADSDQKRILKFSITGAEGEKQL